ncbi:uncharacterized protein [Diadema antillarum]|uniref:uncharacterized protein n=1 Tax=Diadema antillarum TaxID=105358 RepID=UPI003A8BF814
MDEQTSDDYPMYHQDPYMPQPSSPLRTPESLDTGFTRMQPLNMHANGNAREEMSAPASAAGMENAAMLSFLQQQNQLMRMLVEQNMKASLPQKQVKPFTGDPLHYHSFVRAFEHTIEAKTCSDSDRLYYLDQYTLGEANAIVKSCMYGQDQTVAYRKAKDLLRRKFGNRQLIVETMMMKAVQWPDIKPEDGEELHRFSIFVTELHNLARDLNMESEVNHSHNIRLIIGKLPYKLRDKWRNRADDIQEEKQGNITFDDVVSFIAKQARIATNPVYGNLKYQAKPPAKFVGTGKVSASAGKSSFSTSAMPAAKAESRKEVCLFCSRGTHTLADCTVLASKPYEDRLSFCKKEGLCFSCLQGAAHFARNCKRRLKCSICSKQHPTVLHREWKVDQPKRENNSSGTRQQAIEPEASATITQQPQQNSENKNQAVASNTIKCSLNTSSPGNDTLPGIVPVRVRSRRTGVCKETYAFIDSGSNAVFCTEKLATTLNVQGKTINLHMSTMTDEKITTSQVLRDLEVMDVQGHNIIRLPEVYSQQYIPVDKEDIPRQEDVQKWRYLQNIEMPSLAEEAHVGLLIGSNVPRAMEPVEVISSEVPNGPFACRTVLGWLVYGVSRDGARGNKIQSHRVKAKADIDQQFERLFNQDFNERIIDDKEEKSQEDLIFIKKVEQSMKLEDGHYEIALPFRRDDVKLPNNKLQAMQRAGHLKRRFERQADFKREYTDFVDSMMKKEYMEKIPEEEIQRTDGRVWYLPHHGVVHPQKGKLRVVFDCSAEYGDFSLNRELLQGPDLANKLFGVLTRFRQDRVAMQADIEGMFSQIRVPKRDRDMLRFLWWENGDIERPLTEHRMKVHVFGAVSSPSCANFALKRAAQDQTGSFSDEVIRTVHRNFYVDDCLCSTQSVQEAEKLVSDLTEICRGRGFRLTKWLCNEPEVLAKIPVEERAKSVRDLSLDVKNEITEKALGIVWSTNEDTLGVTINLKDKPETRRGILSTVSSVYDPIGCVAPVVLPAKQLLQVLCRSRLGWDAKIPPDLLRKWHTWKTELPRLMEFKMARCLKPPDFEPDSVTLHHFCDASEKGYGSVTYLRWKNAERVQMKFVTSKARVAPLKEVSIPRMELTAATVAVRVDHVIKQELDILIDETFFWTDSMTVLGYINNDTSRFKTFVANRVAVIRDGSKPNQWRYVESSVNPADMCSRGIEADKFLQSDVWKEGPEFLQTPDEEWLTRSEVSPSNLHVELELKKTCLATEVTKEETFNPISELIHHYSDWMRLKRAVCWLRRFVKWMSQKKEQTTSQEESLKGRLTLQEMQAAETKIVGFAQSEAFPSEIERLQNEGSIQTASKGERKTQVKRTSPIYRLDPELDEGLLRVGGRLSRGSLPMNVKHPVILPKKSHVSKLILEHIHKMSGHSGRNYVLARLHQNYWMPSANSAVRKITGTCIQCRRNRAKVLQQKMADLPADRIKPDDPPFTRVGVDFFGPLDVKRGRSVVKRYGVMFTCLAVRAVHIEKADSLSTDSCIAAIRRFIARRGAVQVMRSDNGTNLVGAKRELKREIDAWNQAQINDALLQHNIQWSCNPPGGSHHGGVWERQIRTVRELLFNLVKQQTLDDEGLQTLLCEAEAIINGRPITKVSDDPTDLEALTPNHLLLMKSQPQLPPTVTRETDVYARRRWRQVQYMSDLFWRRWTKEYLPQLQQRQKWVEPQRNLQVGDLVLLVDQTLPRNTWLLGRVTRTLPDAEGYVRSVEVKTKLGAYTRPISKLCLLLEGDV